MYILDSDVLTMLDGSRKDANVRKWFDALDETDIFICVIAIFEKSKNAQKLSRDGKTDDAKKAEATLTLLKAQFSGRILNLDGAAAEAWGRMLGKKDKHWKDAATLAIANQNGFQVATRNAKDYVIHGGTIVDPFKNPTRQIGPTD